MSIVWVVRGGQLQTVFTVMGFVLSGAAGEYLRYCQDQFVEILTHTVAELALVALYFQVTTSNWVLGGILAKAILTSSNVQSPAKSKSGRRCSMDDNLYKDKEGRSAGGGTKVTSTQGIPGKSIYHQRSHNVRGQNVVNKGRWRKTKELLPLTWTLNDILGCYLVMPTCLFAETEILRCCSRLGLGRQLGRRNSTLVHVVERGTNGSVDQREISKEKSHATLLEWGYCTCCI